MYAGPGRMEGQKSKAGIRKELHGSGEIRSLLSSQRVTSTVRRRKSEKEKEDLATDKGMETMNEKNSMMTLIMGLVRL